MPIKIKSEKKSLHDELLMFAQINEEKIKQINHCESTKEMYKD